VNTLLSSHGRRVFKSLALWLGLAALMVQGLAPLCAAGMMGETPGNLASIVICTVHGSQTVPIGADGKPFPARPSHDDQNCCSACPGAGGFIAAAPIAVAVPSSIVVAGAGFAPAPVTIQRFYSSYISRGPPPALSAEFA